jgi:hypothetical protein
MVQDYHSYPDIFSIKKIQAKMLFGDTEIKASAIDVATNQVIRQADAFL